MVVHSEESLAVGVRAVRGDQHADLAPRGRAAAVQCVRAAAVPGDGAEQQGEARRRRRRLAAPRRPLLSQCNVGDSVHPSTGRQVRALPRHTQCARRQQLPPAVAVDGMGV